MRTPQPPSLRTQLLRIASAIAIVGVTGWYSPILIAAGWRVFHPTGKARYQGLQILVPWPWIADIEQVNAENYAVPQGVLLKRLAGNLAHSGPSETIFVDVISPGGHESSADQTRKWLSTFKDSHPGAVVAATHEVPDAQCVFAHPAVTPPEAVATCISVSGGWVATFEGTSSRIPTFVRVASSLKRR